MPRFMLFVMRWSSFLFFASFLINWIQMLVILFALSWTCSGVFERISSEVWSNAFINFYKFNEFSVIAEAYVYFMSNIVWCFLYYRWCMWIKIAFFNKFSANVHQGYHTETQLDKRNDICHWSTNYIVSTWIFGSVSTGMFNCKKTFQNPNYI